MRTKILMAVVAVAVVGMFIGTSVFAQEDLSKILMDRELKTPYELIREKILGSSTVDFTSGIQVKRDNFVKSNMRGSSQERMRYVQLARPSNYELIRLALAKVQTHTANIIYEIKKTAIKDFAHRLGVPETDERIMVVRFEVIEGIYYVDLRFVPAWTTNGIYLPEPVYDIANSSYEIVIINDRVLIKELAFSREKGNSGERYTVVSDYDNRGVLTSQHTDGEIYKKRWSIPDYITIVTERYTIDATRIDAFGTVRETIKKAGKIRPDGAITEQYRVVSQYNACGILVSQRTEGVKLNAIGQITERYIKEATRIDLYGTILKEYAKGIVFEGQDEAAGFYTTESRYNEFGVLTECSSDLLIPNNSGQPGIERNLRVIYDIDVNGEIRYTHVYDESGKEIKVLSGDGYRDSGSLIIEYLQQYADLTEKAREKMVVHNDNINDVRAGAEARDAAGNNFNNLHCAYEDLFSQLPPNHPFKHLEFPLPDLYVPVNEAIHNSQLEIEALIEAIRAGDLDVIREHLGIDIPEVPQALDGLKMYIILYAEYSAQISEQLPAIRQYMEMWNAKETAIKDLAARLRVLADEIVVVENVVEPAIDEYGVFKITLLHRYIENRPLGEMQTQGTITPQPYGEYTYIVHTEKRQTIWGETITLYFIDRVEYFDGSYDIYEYEQIPVDNGIPTFGVARIEQFDTHGTHKATISYVERSDWYVFPTGRIQFIIHYETGENGEQKVKYVDEYVYIDEGAIDPCNPPLAGFKVLRYEGELRTPETEPVCVFYYEGKLGLEKLTRCEFANGIFIGYEDNLARTVCKTTVADDGSQTTYVLMSFQYDMDENGNIHSTRVIYPNGQIDIHRGLADPVDVVITYLQQYGDLIRAFYALDTNRDGILTADEAYPVIVKIRAALGKTRGQEGYVEAYDVDQNGGINLGDYLIAANIALTSMSAAEQNKYRALTALDTNRDGILTADEAYPVIVKIRAALGKTRGQEGYVEAYDVDQNGGINLGDYLIAANIALTSMSAAEQNKYRALSALLSVELKNKNVLVDSEVLARKAIETIVAAQTSDKRFVNEMANPPKELVANSQK